MASDVSKNWSLLVEAASQVCEQVRDRDLVFRQHYQSVNSLAYFWAWYFTALRWGEEQGLKELEKDLLEKGLLTTLKSSVDRWLICSQWADVWAHANAQNVAGYASRLAQEMQTLSGTSKISDLVSGLKSYLEKELKDLEPAATNGLLAMSAYSRQMVRSYYTALWLWNWLDENRWQKAKVTLRHGRRQPSLEVDHIVAWDLWKSKLEKSQREELGDEGDAIDVIIELNSKVNELGNCMLLEKNFNISKSNLPLKEFLQGVHEFKEGTWTIEAWASALDLEMSQVDSGQASVEKLSELATDRTKKIQNDLEQFVRGTKTRIDLS